jgi:hypothetical protein
MTRHGGLPVPYSSSFTMRSRCLGWPQKLADLSSWPANYEGVRPFPIRRTATGKEQFPNNDFKADMAKEVPRTCKTLTGTCPRNHDRHNITYRSQQRKWDIHQQRRTTRDRLLPWLSPQLQRQTKPKPRGLNTKPTFACVQTNHDARMSPSKKWVASKKE